MRSDAERNRERILDAARDAFAELGLNASTNEIARRSGVGVATLFRRFPSRDDLIAEVFRDRMAAYFAASDAALANPDPWLGFCGYIEAICQMQAEDRAFADALTMTFPMSKALETERNHAAEALSRLIDRAKSSGKLRLDFAHQDVPLILMANAGVVNATRDAAPDAWKRLVGFIIRACSTVDDTLTMPDPPAPDRVFRAMMRQHPG